MDEVRPTNPMPPDETPAYVGTSAENAAAEPPLRGPSETGEILESEKLLAARLPERFQIIKVLGRGSFGVVFQARDARLARDVALKVLRPEWNAHPTVKARFLQESRAAARLNHASIVRVLEADEYEGIAWQVCDVIEGTSLSRLIVKGVLDQRTIVRFIADLADAIDNAHRNGIVHRDIKPDNILVKLGDQEDLSDATVHLTDFGLAKVLDDQGYETREGMVVGTPKYLAPELMESNRRCDYKLADIYSLGVVLFECLTGKNPFFAANSMYQRARQETKRVVTIRDVSDSFSRDLDAVCRKAMAFYPDQRYPTAGRFSEDLKAWMLGLPTEARPISSLERLLRFAKESPLVTSLYLMLLLCLLAIAVVQLRANSLIRGQQLELTKANGELEKGLKEAENQEARYKDLAWQSGMREAHHAWSDGTYTVARQRLDQLHTAYPDFQSRAEWQLLDLEMRSRIDVVSLADSSIEEVRAVPATGDVVAVTENGKVLKIDPNSEVTELFDTQNQYKLFSLAAHPTEAKVYFGGTTEDVPRYDLSHVKLLDLKTKSVTVLKPPFVTTLESIELDAKGERLIAASRYENPMMMSSDGVRSKSLIGDRHNRWMGRLSLGDEYFVYHRSPTSVELVKLSGNLDESKSTEVRFRPDVFSNTILFAGAITNSPFLVVAFADFRGLTVLDCRNWKVVQILQRDVTTNVSSFASDSTGGIIAIGMDSGEVIVWDISQQNWYRELRTAAQPQAAVDFPDVIDVKEDSIDGRTADPLSPLGNWAVSNASIQSLTFRGHLLFGGTKAGELLRVDLRGLTDVSRYASSNIPETTRETVKSTMWASASGDLFVECLHGKWYRIARDIIDDALAQTSFTSNRPFVSNNRNAFVRAGAGIRDIDIHVLLQKAILIRKPTSGFDPDEVRLSESGNALVWLEQNNELMLWRSNGKTGAVQIPIEEPVEGIVAISPRGEYLILRGENHFCLFVDLTREKNKVTKFPCPDSFSYADWHPSLKRFVMGGEMRQLLEYDYEQKSTIVVELPDDAAVTAITYIDEGKRVVTTHGDGVVRVVDLVTKKVESLSIHRDFVSSLVVDPKTRFGLSVDRFGDLKLWFLDPMDIIGSLRHEDRTKMRAQFRGPKLWISKSGKQIAATFFEPDGVTLRFWNY